MKRILMAMMIVCFAACAAVAAPKATAAKLSDKDIAGGVVKAFLEKMDTGKYEEAYAYMDFDALLLDQTKKDPSKLDPKQKDMQIKSYKNLAKNMFVSEKKQTKFRNFTLGEFKKTGDKATLQLINTPPKGTNGAPVVKIFKLVSIKGEWKIYGNVMQGMK
jgi:hypothetical protein